MTGDEALRGVVSGEQGLSMRSLESYAGVGFYSESNGSQ